MAFDCLIFTLTLSLLPILKSVCYFRGSGQYLRTNYCHSFPIPDATGTKKKTGDALGPGFLGKVSGWSIQVCQREKGLGPVSDRYSCIPSSSTGLSFGPGVSQTRRLATAMLPWQPTPLIARRMQKSTPLKLPSSWGS